MANPNPELETQSNDDSFSIGTPTSEYTFELPSAEWLESSVAKKRAQLDLIEQLSTTEFEFPRLTIEDNNADTSTELSGEKSSEYSPILTPSSSCGSLASLYYSQSSVERGIWRAGSGLSTTNVLEDSSNHSRTSIDRYPGDEEVLCDSQLRNFEDCEIKGAEAEDPSSPALLNLPPLPKFLPTTTITTASSPSDLKNPWNPAAEVHAAKQRFLKHSKTARIHPAPRILREYKAAPRDLVQLPLLDMKSEKVEKGCWKTLIDYLCWRAPEGGIEEREGKRLGYGARYFHVESLFEEHVREVGERVYSVPGGYREAWVEGDEVGAGTGRSNC